MQEKIYSRLSILLILGILIAVLLVITGASLYLLQNGGNLISHEHLSQFSGTSFSFIQILHEAKAFKPLALIQLGFFILVFFQILRALLIGFFFLRSTEYVLAFSSFFIFIVLVYSMLGH